MDPFCGSGDVQRMSAGTGIRHSEFNASTEDIVIFTNLGPSRKEVEYRVTKSEISPVKNATNYVFWSVEILKMKHFILISIKLLVLNRYRSSNW